MWLLPDLPSAIMTTPSSPASSPLRLLPDLPSTIICQCPSPKVDPDVAVAPRSPIGYNLTRASQRPSSITESATLLRLLPDLPSAIIRPEIDTRSAQRVAVAPRSPIGYNRSQHLPRRHHVAVAPRSPIGYNSNMDTGFTHAVAVAPRSPIGYNPVATHHGRCRPCCGCSPISHRL